MHSLYPDIAAKLMSVNASCEDGGIRMEVEGVSINGNFAYVYISMQDLEGKRIDESIDLFDSYSIHTNADEIAGCTLVDFEKKNRKAMFLIAVQNMDDTPIEGEALTFSVSKFLSGKSEMRGELTQIYLDSLSLVTETQAEEDLNIRGRSYTDGEAAKEMTKEYIFDINSNELKECQIYGHFFTCKNLVTGNWKVKFAIENRN